MKKIVLMLLGFAAILSCVACGQHADGLSGAMTVSATASPISGVYGWYQISGSVQYSNSNRSDFLGLKIKLTFPDDQTMEIVTNESGKFDFWYPIEQSTSYNLTGPVVATVDKVNGYSSVLYIPRISASSFLVTPPANVTANTPLLNPVHSFTFDPESQLAQYLLGYEGLTTVQARLTLIGCTFNGTPAACADGTTTCTLPLRDTTMPGTYNPTDSVIQIAFTNLSGVGNSKTCYVSWTISDTDPAHTQSVPGSAMRTVTFTKQ